MARLYEFKMLAKLVIGTLSMTSIVSSRGMMAKRDGDIGGSMSRNLMDKNFNFAEQVLETLMH